MLFFTLYYIKFYRKINHRIIKLMQCDLRERHKVLKIEIF